MPKIDECLPLEKFMLFQENKLPQKEREEVLLHVANCNECAMGDLIYNEFEDLPSENEYSPCPSLSVFTLLLENKLDESKSTDVFRHMADCNECALTYSIAKEMLQAEIVECEDECEEDDDEDEDEATKAALTPQGPEAAVIIRKTPIWLTQRFLSNAAVIVLLVGASYYGGFSYARSTPFSIIQEFESSPLYWSKLDDSIKYESSSMRATRGLVTRSHNNVQPVSVPSVQDILKLKDEFDKRLISIVNLSNQGIDTVLSVKDLNILAMTSSDIEIYAALIRDAKK
jgi:hypothetical protein